MWLSWCRGGMSQHPLTLGGSACTMLALLLLLGLLTVGWTVSVDAEKVAEEWTQVTLVDSLENEFMDSERVGFIQTDVVELSAVDQEPKEVVAKATLNPLAVKLPSKPTAQVLTAQEHQAKWAAFKAANPKKKYKSSAEEQAAFNTFQANRAKILEQNNAAGTKLNPKPFSSKGPFADIPKDQFRLTHLKLSPPKKASSTSSNNHRFVQAAKGWTTPKRASNSKKSRIPTTPVQSVVDHGSDETSASQELHGAGHGVGSSGKSASASGKSASNAGGDAGASGKSASASGKSGSASGTSAGASGKSASDAGGEAEASGKSGSASGKSGSASGKSGSASGKSGSDSNGPIVAPTKEELAAAEAFQPYTGSAFNNPMDATIAQRVCRVVSHVWFARYASTAVEKLMEFGLSTIQGGGFERYQKDPMLLCSASGLAVVWDKLRPKQQLIREIFKELMARPAGTPFMNPVVATSDQPLDQEQCGSCYAQAAIGSLEAALKKAGRYTGPLSIQQAIDCVRTKETKGCGGGTPMDVIDYFKTTAPSLATDYPYTGIQGRCNIKHANSNQRSTGWSFVKPPAQGVNVNAYKPCIAGDCADQHKYETDLFYGVKSAGPYIAYVDASNWQHYGGGIYPPDKCSSTNEAGNHVIQLLGYGQQDGIPYWIIKNSWGPEWGEKGYIRLPMGVNSCGIANYVLQATVI